MNMKLMMTLVAGILCMGCMTHRVTHLTTTFAAKQQREVVIVVEKNDYAWDVPIAGGAQRTLWRSLNYYGLSFSAFSNRLSLVSVAKLYQTNNPSESVGEVALALAAGLDAGLVYRCSPDTPTQFATNTSWAIRQVHGRWYGLFFLESSSDSKIATVRDLESGTSLSHEMRAPLFCSWDESRDEIMLRSRMTTGLAAPGDFRYLPERLVVWRYMTNDVEDLHLDRTAVDKALWEYIRKQKN